MIPTLIAPFLKQQGYKKGGNNWHLDTPEAILVIQIQKSAYAQQWYINLGVWLKALGPATTPPENQCHIRSSLLGKQTEKALSLEITSITDAKRQKTIVTSLVQRALPFLQYCSTIDGIKTMVREGKLKNALVTKEVWELVGSL